MDPCPRARSLLVAVPFCSFAAGVASCTAPPPAAAPSAATPAATTAAAATSAAPPPAVAAARTTPDPERGGRLYDSWRTERHLSNSFAYDDPRTPALDGKGGPNGNGTLNDGGGRPMPNSGHDYRLQSWFGWDLRGKQGVSGPHYHAEPFALDRNLLADTRSPAQIRDWLAHGDDQTPAYRDVLDDRDLDDLTAFLVQTRDGALARPEQVFRLDAKAPAGYTLLPGANPERGRELFGFVCADCHGKDGRELPFDHGQTLGVFVRLRGYEAWFKIQNGVAGSPMQGQITEATGANASQAVLDLMAALCDRKLFPALRGSAETDAPDADARCGAYLK